MDRLRKLLYPGGKWVTLFVLLGAAGLALTFGTPLGDTGFAYAAYLFSAYALVIAAAWTASKLRPVLTRFLHGIPLIHRYLTDEYFHVRAGVLISLLVNLLFAALKLGGAILYTSFWDGALAVYYILLCAVRLYLIRRIPASRERTDHTKELLSYRAVGCFLFPLNIALAIVSVQIIRKGQGYYYPGTMIYAMAAYAFYCLILSFANAVRYRKYKSPVLSAAKVLNLTCALVSIFSLETAMLSQFGPGESAFRTVMTSATAAVCAAVLGLAVYMVIHSTRQIHLLKERTT